MKTSIQTFPQPNSLEELKNARYGLHEKSYSVSKKTIDRRAACNAAEIRTRSCQTLYRESDAQTVPWYPPYLTHQTKTPEVVIFSSLPFENACVDQHDIEIVKRNRKIQEWEKYLASIPPTKTELRNTIIYKIEQDKWNFREKEIDEENKRRLIEAQKEMKEQRAIVQERINWRKKNVQEKWEKKKNVTLPLIKTRLDRDLRRLNFIMNKPSYPDKARSNEIIDEYYSGALKLPPARLGKNPKRSSEVLCKAAFPSSMKDAYLMLESSLAQPKKNVDHGKKNKVVVKHDCEHKRLHQPESLQGTFSKSKPHFEENKPGLETLESLIKPTTEDHQFQQDIKLIQCLIRGRAVQNMMIRQLKANLALLKERGLFASNEDLANAKKNAVEVLCEHFTSMEMKDKVESIIGRLQGHTVSAALDFSAKELMRMEEQRRLHVLAQTAEKDRWAREAAEAGRRQEEEQRQRQHEEIYKEVMKTHEFSSDALIRNILEDQIHDTGKGLATIWTRKAADVYDQVIPEPCADAYKKQEYVSCFVDRCLVTQSENEHIEQQRNQKETEFKTLSNNILSEFKKDFEDQYSTESVDTFDSEGSSSLPKSNNNLGPEHYQKELHIIDDEKKNGKDSLKLSVEKDKGSDILIKSYELDNVNKKLIRKLLEYSYRKEESSDSEMDDNKELINIAGGDCKALRRHLRKKEKELLKKFVEKPNLLFQKSQAFSEYSEDSDETTNSSEQMLLERTPPGRKRRLTSIETEESFQQKCLEKKGERIMNEVLNIAEGYIEKYQMASEKEGFSLGMLQKNYSDTMTEAYRILSVALLKLSDKKSKTNFEKVLKPWVNTILNEVTKSLRNMFTSLAVEEIEEEIPEEFKTEEEEDVLKPEEIDQMLIDSTVRDRLANIHDAIPGHHIFRNEKFYCCPEEEVGPESSGGVQTEAESDLDDGKPVKYTGVLNEKATETFIPENKLQKY